MARGIAKQVEGAFAIVLYIMFLLFFLAAVKIKVIDIITKNQQFPQEKYAIDNLLYKLEVPFYLINFTISIPKAMKTYVCNLTAPDLHRDFCTDFPIYYPLNLSAIIKYSGVVEGDPYSYYDPVDGLFFYANFSNFTKCISSNTVKVKVYNPNSYSLTDYQIFITSPTIRDWLEKGYHLSVKDSNGNYYYFCYHHQDFVCNNTPNGAYGIWLKVTITPYSSLELMINKTDTSNSYEVNGSKIFVFYDHFTKNPSNSNWDLNDMDCSLIGSTKWKCAYNSSSFSSYYYYYYIDNKTYLPGNWIYTIYFKGFYDDTLFQSNIYLVKIKNSGGLASNPTWLISLPDTNNFLIGYITNLNKNKKYALVIGNYSGYPNKFTMDFVVIKKQADIEPLITIEEDGIKCYRRYSIIVGESVSRKLINNIGYKKEDGDMYISNKYLKYYLYYYSPDDDTYYYNLLYDSYSTFYYLDNIFYITITDDISYYTGNFEKNNIAVYYKNTSSFNMLNILFANSRWFIVYLDNITQSSNIYSTRPILFSDGSLIPGTNQKCKTNFISETTDFNYEKFYNDLYLPGGIYTLSFYENTNVNPDRYLILSHNPALSTYYYITPDYDQFFSIYKSYYPAKTYRGFMLYFYAYNNSINNINDLDAHFILPKVEVRGIKKIYAIPIDNISNSTIPTDVYIYFPYYKEGFGNPNVQKAFSYYVEKLVYVFDRNSDKVVKTPLIIYIK